MALLDRETFGKRRRRVRLAMGKLKYHVAGRKMGSWTGSVRLWLECPTRRDGKTVDTRFELETSREELSSFIKAISSDRD